METELREIISERNKIVLILNGFKYCFANTNKLGETRWRCIKKNICTTSLNTVGESMCRTVTSIKGQHVHDPDMENKIQRQIVSTSCKRKAIEDISERPRKVLHLALKDTAGATENLTTNDLTYIRRNLYNSRRKLLPPLPQSIEEVHSSLEHLVPKTTRGENFVLVNNQETRVIVFGAKSNLNILCSSDIIYADGTFQYCPKYFFQLFTLHGYVNNNYVPLVFCLLNDKTEKTYINCLNTVKLLCLTKSLTFSPKEIVIDFELSIHNAVRNVWKDIKVTGCRFHLAQAWWRKIQKLGLINEYKNQNSEIGMWLHYCFGIMFLDSQLVSDFFVFDLLAIQPQNEALSKFSDYLVEYTFPRKNRRFLHIFRQKPQQS